MFDYQSFQNLVRQLHPCVDFQFSMSSHRLHLLDCFYCSWNRNHCHLTATKNRFIKSRKRWKTQLNLNWNFCLTCSSSELLSLIVFNSVFFFKFFYYATFLKKESFDLAEKINLEIYSKILDSFWKAGILIFHQSCLNFSFSFIKR